MQIPCNLHGDCICSEGLIVRLISIVALIDNTWHSLLNFFFLNKKRRQGTQSSSSLASPSSVSISARSRIQSHYFVFPPSPPTIYRRLTPSTSEKTVDHIALFSSTNDGFPSLSGNKYLALLGSKDAVQSHRRKEAPTPILKTTLPCLCFSFLKKF